MKRLLIVYHTQGGHTGAMAEAVLRGARRAAETETVMLRAGCLLYTSPSPRD